MSDKLVSDLDWWDQHNRGVRDRLLRMIGDTLADPFRGIGKPEPLKHEYQGLWSRRLTRSDRLVYRVSEDRVYFLPARLHYPSR